MCVCVEGAREKGESETDRQKDRQTETILNAYAGDNTETNFFFSLNNVHTQLLVSFFCCFFVFLLVTGLAHSLVNH